MNECPTCQSCFPDSVTQCKYDGQTTKSTFHFGINIGGRYRLERRLGQRSVSAVYLADDSLLHTKCAIKIILPDLIGDDASLAESFIVEARAVANILHPNIVRIRDSGLLDEVVPFVVMELVSGKTLQNVLSASGPITPTQALEYLLPITLGLSTAHQQRIVHGDLKPRNILIANNKPLSEAIKISDFGLALLKSGKLLGPEVDRKSSGMLRSPLYLAPEEWSEEETDSRSDIYSLGVILYQMLSGDVPFKGKSTPAIMKQHLMNAPPPIASVSNGISKELEEVVMHALEKQPDDRPQTVEQLIEELEFVINDKAGATIVVPIKPRMEVVEQADKPFMGEMTIVNQNWRHEIAEIEESEELDPGATIVISKKDLLAAKDIETEPQSPVQLQTTLHSSPNFDMTIVPGKIEPLLVEEVHDVAVADYENEVIDDPIDDARPVYDEDSFVDDSTNDQADATIPRSVSPMWLAVGVILMIVLLGVGIYYVRVSQ